jgi:3-oxoacyl-[acyl-carrier protein] reductase
MHIDFAGKTVIVTGGGHGFGRAIAHAFAARGAAAWTCDINAEGLLVTKTEAKPASGGRIEVRTVDITDVDAVGTFVGEARAGSGRIDVLVNNAGGVCGQVGQPIEAVTPRQWQQIFDVNVTGAFNFAQAVVPSMKASASGRIVNISSGAGLGVSLTGIQAYASAKAAQIGLTRQLAHELGPFGITVNNIAPGFVRSNPTTEKQWASYGADGQKRLVESIALRRLGTPDDIAHAVLFFASDYAGWITGQVLSVSGGK